MREMKCFAVGLALMGMIAPCAWGDILRFDIEDDTFINNDYYNLSQNHGNESSIEASYAVTWSWAELLIKHTGLFGNESAQIDPGDIITNAELHLWLDDSWGNETNTFTLYQLSTDWNEQTVTAASYGRVTDNTTTPPIASLAGPTTNPYYTNTEYIFDITTSLLSWQSGVPNYGWGMTGSSDRNAFFSSDYSNYDLRPYLIVQTEAGSPVPEPATMLLLGSGLLTLAAARRRRGRKG